MGQPIAKLVCSEPRPIYSEPQQKLAGCWKTPKLEKNSDSGRKVNAHDSRGAMKSGAFERLINSYTGRTPKCCPPLPFLSKTYCVAEGALSNVFRMAALCCRPASESLCFQYIL